MQNLHKKMTMGVIVGNRGFFPDHLAKSGREEMIKALERAGMDVVILDEQQSKYGAVETHEEAKRCAELFRKNSGRIDGIVVTLPNFGDERAVREHDALASAEPPSGTNQRLPVVCSQVTADGQKQHLGAPATVLFDAKQPRGKHPALVGDQQITRTQVRANVAKMAMFNKPGTTMQNKQSRAIAGFNGCLSDQLVGQVV